ncbi:MAG: type II secretory pathway protein, partial [Desulfobacterales bacterium]
MDYFNILNLKQEPFSNSPDPDFFFHSREHRECLQKLELSLLLRRGLNVIIGDVGTGKTTLCRQLIRNFAKR